MAKASEKDIKEIETALFTGGNLPSGVLLDFTKNPPYRRYDAAELAEIEKTASAELKAAENLPVAPVVPVVSTDAG